MTCIATCPDGFYKLMANNSCEPCDYAVSKCVRCVTTADNCNRIFKLNFLGL